MQMAVHPFYFDEAYEQKHSHKEGAIQTLILGYYVCPFEGLMNFMMGKVAGSYRNGAYKMSPNFKGEIYGQTRVADVAAQCFQEKW